MCTAVQNNEKRCFFSLFIYLCLWAEHGNMLNLGTPSSEALILECSEKWLSWNFWLSLGKYIRWNASFKQKMLPLLNLFMGIFVIFSEQLFSVKVMAEVYLSQGLKYAFWVCFWVTILQKNSCALKSFSVSPKTIFLENCLFA